MVSQIMTFVDHEMPFWIFLNVMDIYDVRKKINHEEIIKEFVGYP